MAELNVPSELGDGEIKLYQFGNGRWKRKAGDQTRTLSKDKTPESLGADEAAPAGGHVPADGDWLIRLRNGQSILVPKDDNGPIANVYYLGQSGKHWHKLVVNRSTGTREILRRFLTTKPFSIVVSRGEELPLTLFEPGKEPVDLIDEHVVVVRAGDDAAFAGNTDDSGRSRGLGKARDAPTPAQQSIDRLCVELAEESEKYTTALTSSGFQAELDRLRNSADPDRHNSMLQLVLKALDEAVPTPSTSPITGITDYWSLVNSIDDMKVDGSTGSYFPDEPNMDFDVGQVSSLLASMGLVVQYAREIRNMATLTNSAPGSDVGNRQFQGELNTSAGNAAMAVPKSITNLVGAADLVAKAANSPVWAGALQSVGQVTGPASIVISVITVARSSRKAHRARLRRNKLNSHLKDLPAGGENDELRRCISFLFHKVQRKLLVQAETAVAASASALGGSILVGVAITGAANLWNPVGWGIVAGGAAIGTGLLGYAIYRRLSRTSRRNNRKKKSTGKVLDTQSAARELIKFALNYKNEKQKAIATAVLREFGITEPDLLTREDVRETSIAMIVRHCSR